MQCLIRLRTRIKRFGLVYTEHNIPKVLRLENWEKMTWTRFWRGYFSCKTRSFDWYCGYFGNLKKIPGFFWLVFLTPPCAWILFFFHVYFFLGISMFIKGWGVGSESMWAVWAVEGNLVSTDSSYRGLYRYYPRLYQDYFISHEHQSIISWNTYNKNNFIGSCHLSFFLQKLYAKFEEINHPKINQT